MTERNVSDRELASKGTCTERLWDMYTYAEELWKRIQAEQLAVGKPWRSFCSRSDLALSTANSISVDLVSVKSSGPNSLDVGRNHRHWDSSRQICGGCLRASWNREWEGEKRCGYLAFSV